MKFWADENFNGHILRGLQRLYPTLDVIRVQDTHLMSIPDPDLLEEASKVGAILLSHDVTTMSDFAYARIRDGKRMTGLILVHKAMLIGDAIAEIATLIELATSPDDVINEVMWI